MKALIERFIEMGQGAGGRVDSGAQLPKGLGALESVDDEVKALYRGFFQRRREYEERDGMYIFRTPTVALYKEEGEALPLFLGLIRLQTYQQEDDEHFYRVEGPDGEEVMSGELDVDTFDNQPGDEVIIPADAPSGVYRLEFKIRSIHDDSTRSFRQLRGIRMPVSDVGVLEVIVLEEERMGPFSVGGSHGVPGYFFYVPEEVTEFSVDDVYSRFGPLIRNPEGEIVWRKDQGRHSATITVPPEHRGQLWRIVGSGFKMDPQIPPYYSVNPDQWFHPEGK